MAYDDSKIDELVLTLLGAWEFDNGRVWKRIDFGAMERLFAGGYITDPHGRTESVQLTNEGLALARDLAAKHLIRG